jgi:hypothetical protein
MRLNVKQHRITLNVSSIVTKGRFGIYLVDFNNQLLAINLAWLSFFIE